MSSRMALALVAFVLLVGGAVLWQFIEWREVEVPGPPSEEARRNPYLAAERFLERFGVEVEQAKGIALLDALPSTRHTIAIGSSLRTVSERRANNLLDWIANGGRLLVVASDVYNTSLEESGNRLLDALGIELHVFDGELDETEQEEEETPDRKSFGELLEEAVASQNNCPDNLRLTSVDLSDEPRELDVAFESRRYLSFPEDAGYGYAASETGVQLVGADYGAGFVMVVTSFAPWSNWRIGCHDHAHVLRWVAEDRDKLWVLFDTEMPNLARILWQRWHVAIALLALAVLVWLWATLRQPVRANVQQTSKQRSLLSQVRGTARFMWQQDQQELLLEQARARLRAAAGTALDQQSWLATLSERSGVTEARIQWALTHNSVRDPLEARRMVRTLVILERYL